MFGALRPVLTESPREQLDRDRTLHPRFKRFKHDPHATATQLPHDAIFSELLDPKLLREAVTQDFRLLPIAAMLERFHEREQFANVVREFLVPLRICFDRRVESSPHLVREQCHQDIKLLARSQTGGVQLRRKAIEIQFGEIRRERHVRQTIRKRKGRQHLDGHHAVTVRIG